MEPVGAIAVHEPATNTRTADGAVPVVSRTKTENVKLVAVVPDPGDAVPFVIVSVPQVRAWTGTVDQTSSATIQPASARTRPALVMRRRYEGRGTLSPVGNRPYGAGG